MLTLIQFRTKIFKKISAKNLPGFGMWANRKNIVDTKQWVRALRKPRFKL
jgi:hypothetical protein